jgi:hypothetical protein
MPDSCPRERRSLAARAVARACGSGRCGVEAELSDPITPPAARWPSEAADLVALAVSDGDLGAAVAQYEPAAALLPWASDGDGRPGGHRLDGGVSPDGLTSLDSSSSLDGLNSQDGTDGLWDDSQACLPVADIMAAIMSLRLPLDVRLIAALPAAGLTMLVCERRIAGQGPDGQPVSLHGVGYTVVRPQDDGSWRIAADAWCLAQQGP